MCLTIVECMIECLSVCMNCSAQSVRNLPNYLFYIRQDQWRSQHFVLGGLNKKNIIEKKIIEKKTIYLIY